MDEGRKMTHHLKLSCHYADAVLAGQKNFEIRYNDRGFQRGDKVVFTVVDDCKITMSHPLNRETFLITYLVHGFGLEKDWCVFGIRPMGKSTEDDNGER